MGALLGPQLTTAECLGEMERMTYILEVKRGILAKVQGTMATDSEKCGLTAENAGDDEVTECIVRGFNQLMRLKQRVFNVAGNIKEEYQPAAHMFQDYGRKGLSVCQDVGFCPSPQVEKYIHTWLKNNRDSTDEAASSDKKAEENLPPGKKDSKEVAAFAENYDFDERTNPVSGVRVIGPG